jgi:hypothetical protein
MPLYGFWPGVKGAAGGERSRIPVTSCERGVIEASSPCRCNRFNNHHEVSYVQYVGYNLETFGNRDAS